jgi:hypothetical protein
MSATNSECALAVRFAPELVADATKALNAALRQMPPLPLDIHAIRNAAWESGTGTTNARGE